MVFIRVFAPHQGAIGPIGRGLDQRAPRAQICPLGSLLPLLGALGGLAWFFDDQRLLEPFFPLEGAEFEGDYRNQDEADESDYFRLIFGPESLRLQLQGLYRLSGFRLL